MNASGTTPATQAFEVCSCCDSLASGAGAAPARSFQALARQGLSWDTMDRRRRFIFFSVHPSA